jgi:hypothetical protein
MDYCLNDPRHIAVRGYLKMTLTDEEYNNRYKKYEKECKICGNNADCLAQTLTNLQRDSSTYPWSNYDWNYSNYIDNNYSAMATGSSPSNGVFNNINISSKIANGYIFDPNPGSNSVAGGRDINDRTSDIPVYGCLENNKEGCEKLWKVKKSGNHGIPYKDDFFLKNKTDGLKSSSYYFKIGICDRPDILDASSCINRGFNWAGNKCFQDRYAYMNNEGGISLFKGLIPSMTTDILAFAPNYIIDSLSGKSSSYMEIQNCPKIEKFTIDNDNNNNKIYFVLLLSLLLIEITRRII